jgi:hypothetical protein
VDNFVDNFGVKCGKLSKEKQGILAGFWVYLECSLRDG